MFHVKHFAPVLASRLATNVSRETLLLRIRRVYDQDFASAIAGANVERQAEISERQIKRKRSRHILDQCYQPIANLRCVAPIGLDFNPETRRGDNVQPELQRDFGEIDLDTAGEESLASGTVRKLKRDSSSKFRTSDSQPLFVPPDPKTVGFIIDQAALKSLFTVWMPGD